VTFCTSRPVENSQTVTDYPDGRHRDAD